MKWFNSFVDLLVVKPKVTAESTPILIASALHQELTPFLKKHKWTPEAHDKNVKRLNFANSKGQKFNLIAYSLNQMGMPLNGVALTKVIEQYNPRYVIFIGSCAGLNPKTSKNKDGNTEGDVLIPEYIYAYDSGKYNDKGEFKIEHRHYDVGRNIRGIAADMLEVKVQGRRFKVTQDCGFCSGASVMSNKERINEITKSSNRKLAGLDMEAYVLACINNQFPLTETLVIKGIMDFGKKKSDSFKKKALDNSATIANDLVKYIIEKADDYL